MCKEVREARGNNQQEKKISRTVGSSFWLPRHPCFGWFESDVYLAVLWTL